MNWPDATSFSISRQDWRTRVIRDTFEVERELAPWMEDAYGAYKERVSDPGYPCYFGHQAEKKGDMFYAFVSWANVPSLVGIMGEFVWRGHQPQYARHNLGVFFEPLATDTHERFCSRSWKILQMLHDADSHPLEGAPSDADWEFSFAGSQMFVVGANVTYSKRRSRCLGQGQVLLFQPRTVFTDAVTERSINMAARRTIRQRLTRWDDVEPHPDLGIYGDPGNREWKQYMLPDENVSVVGECPFLARLPRDGRTAEPREDEVAWQRNSTFLDRT
jgi:FPC/CPF motif-containing protein YcgG